MIIEEIKQALEALQECASIVEHCIIGVDAENAVNNAKDAIKALEQALAKQEQGEPVAWRIRWTDGSVSYRDDEPSDACKSECEVKALYIKE